MTKNTTGIGAIMAKLIKRLNQINTNDATELRILYEIYEGNNDEGKSDLVQDLNSIVNEYYDDHPCVVSYCKELISLLELRMRKTMLSKEAKDLIRKIEFDFVRYLNKGLPRDRDINAINYAPTSIEVSQFLEELVNTLKVYTRLRD